MNAPPPLSSVACTTQLRALVVGCQAATILVTLPLLEVRSSPPLLPVWPIELGVSPAPLLLASLLLVLVRPLAGALLHAALYAVAIVLDETRVQPSLLSLALLLVATASPRLVPLARAHLATQWLWAGAGKLVSPAFFGFVSPALAQALPTWLPWREHAGVAGAVFEIALGVAAALSSLRTAPRVARVVAGAGAALHVTLGLGLAALAINPGACAWNVALAGASALCFSGPLSAEGSPGPRPRIGRAWAATWALLALSPALTYAGVLPPALGHRLYTGTAPTTLVCDAAGRCRSDPESRAAETAFGVPMPPSATLLRRAFLETCSSGDRWLARSRAPGPGYGEVLLDAECPERAR